MMQWNVYERGTDPEDPEGYERVGLRKTLRGAQSLAEKRKGGTIHGWLERDGDSLETLDQRFRLVFDHP